jgi:hypothetical protein
VEEFLRKYQSGNRPSDAPKQMAVT